MLSLCSGHVSKLASGNKCCYFTFSLSLALSLFISPPGRPSNHLLPISWTQPWVYRSFSSSTGLHESSCDRGDAWRRQTGNNWKLFLTELSPSKFIPKPKYLTWSTNSPTLVRPTKNRMQNLLYYINKSRHGLTLYMSDGWCSVKITLLIHKHLNFFYNYFFFLLKLH